ncbi:MAG: hypothetical protein Q4D11_00985 [Rhodospirillales bacterium]|nr:hypothetical protein [Rhodospirillales bacterium]
MRNVIKKINETGTLLVEALAMLGLISMVTPVLYKKASERTVELQDINASSQLRALSTAMDSYLKDKFADISRGETVNGIDYGSFKDNESASKTIEADKIANVLKDYLPYGFLDNDGNLRETKLFNDYSITIKSESELKDGKAVNQTLTSFIVIPPKNDEDFSEKRAARVASMVGSNGGYVTKEPGGDNLYAMGAQGIWKVPVSELGNPTQRTMVISSLQPISSQGLANEDVLHRHDEPDADDELNSMTTDLFLGYGNSQPHNIRMVNQIIMTPVAEGMVNKNTGKPANNDSATTHDDKLGDKYETSLDNALYIGNKGGAYLEGVLKAMDDHFTVTADGIKYFNDKTLVNAGDDPKYSDATFAVSGSQMVYGNPQGGANALKLVVNSGFGGSNNASLDYAISEYEGTNETGAPIMKPGSSVLHADIDRVGMGGIGNYVAGSSNYSFNVIRPTDGDTWNVVMGDSQNVWNGTVTKYAWNGDMPDGGRKDENHNYELSVNGSAYVRDTILTAKLKTFDVDAATLRAGVPHKDFNEADDDKFFFKVRSERDGDDQADALMVGASNAPMITVANSNNNPYNLPTGVVVHTGDATGNGGINIISGTNTVPKINTIYEVSGVDGANGTQDGMVKIGGSEGVYLTTMVGDDFTIAPVSIQGEMFRAYADWGNTDRTIEEIVDTSILSSHGYRYGAPDNMGEREINDMRVTVNDVNDKTVMEITPSLDSEDSSRADDNAVVRMIGRTAIYDWDYNKDNASDGPSFVAEKGKIMVKATATADTAQGIQPGDDILVVDNNGSVADADRGSVYIRKGGINIDTSIAPEGEKQRIRTLNSTIETQYRDPKKAKGYIAADRFVAHYGDHRYLPSLLEASGGSSTGRSLVTYEGYEVNPAYTSVMHDIKLTTRGGARLSDILPDFINKGIYVVDTTYAPNFNWENGSNMLGSEITEAGVEVGEYLGFVPTPKCPPGYAKVVTLTPAGWAMAQAGTPAAASAGTLGYDIYSPSNIQDYINDVNSNNDVSNYVLRFQKSTWLKSLVRQYCGGQFKDSCSGESSFQGWGAVMGFIYPAYMYGGNEDDVAWNIFPVYYKELEGYATVYCYFDRSGFNPDYVYTGYDQLNQVGTGHLNSWDKNSDNNADDLGYLKRLDDPALKYQSPW